MGIAELAGPSISVSACRDLSQCGGLSSWRQSKLLPAEAGMPAGSYGEGGQEMSDGKKKTPQHKSDIKTMIFVISCFVETFRVVLSLVTLLIISIRYNNILLI